MGRGYSLPKEQHDMSTRRNIHIGSGWRLTKVFAWRTITHVARMMPNPITSLDAAVTLLFAIGRQWRGASEFFRWRTRRMTVRTIFLLLLLAHAGFAQSNVYSGRVIAHIPFYERIFLPKGNLLRPRSLRGVDDLKPAEQYVETNRIDRTFPDLSRERTNGFYSSCLSEVPVNDLSLRC